MCFTQRHISTSQIKDGQGPTEGSGHLGLVRVSAWSAEVRITGRASCTSKNQGDLNSSPSDLFPD